jgi:uncharacterized glyoxalase superfamily protein PhnB
VSPYLYYSDATRALAFLVDAFGFTEIAAARDDDGNVWTAELSTGDGVVLIGKEIARLGTRAVADPAWASARTLVYVDDVDRHRERAVAAGATIIAAPADHTGNRIYIATDCGGQQWIFATPTS